MLEELPCRGMMEGARMWRFGTMNGDGLNVHIILSGRHDFSRTCTRHDGIRSNVAGKETNREATTSSKSGNHQLWEMHGAFSITYLIVGTTLTYAAHTSAAAAFESPFKSPFTAKNSP